jgi:hypothetical protein
MLKGLKRNRHLHVLYRCFGRADGAPNRIIQGPIRASAPPKAFCYNPADHAGGGEVLGLGANHNQIQWDQPHEGNLFDHFCARRAFQRTLEAIAA